MADVVLKSINTAVRRLKAGAEVSATDDLSPHNFDDLKARGFIGSSAPPQHYGKLAACVTAATVDGK